MSNYIEIINSLKQSIEIKRKEKEYIEGMILLSDAQLDKYDSLIKNIDSAAIPLIDEVNNAAKELKQAYDDRITSGCKSNLSWELIDEWTNFVTGGSGDGSSTTKVNYKKYQVQINPDNQEDINLVGIKFYRKPIDQDYGTNIVDTFFGDVSSDSTYIRITDEDIGIPSSLQIGDTITDDVDSPFIFDILSLPKIVGFGTTSVVGIVTNLVGGISTGSTVFAHYGTGISTNLQIGYSFERTGIVTSSIVGFGSTQFSVIYYNEDGFFTTGIVTCRAIYLNNASIGYAADVSFNVGETSIIPAIGISTTPKVSGNNVEFTAIRPQGEIDVSEYDITKSPSSPLVIGTINLTTVGSGHSVFFDESGNPNELKRWNVSQSYYDPIKEKVIKPEPIVGAGKYTYNSGNSSWPTLVTASGTPPNVVYTASYASEGTTITIGSTTSTVSTGTTNKSSLNPNNSFCNNLDVIISQKLSVYNEIRSRNNPQIQKLVSSSQSLRRQRDQKQLYAWSLLQSLSSVKLDVTNMESELIEMESIDFSEFDV